MGGKRARSKDGWILQILTLLQTDGKKQRGREQGNRGSTRKAGEDIKKSKPPLRLRRGGELERGALRTKITTYIEGPRRGVT